MKTMLTSAAFALAALGAQAETIEVEMLNRGEAGMMVFQPAYVQAEPGDVVRFVPTDKGHNVQNIEGMLPDGVEDFRSDFSQAFELTVDAEGVYGVKCTPHYGLGMVGIVIVGDDLSNLEAVKAKKYPGKAGKRLAEMFEEISG